MKEKQVCFNLLSKKYFKVSTRIRNKERAI